MTASRTDRERAAAGDLLAAVPLELRQRPQWVLWALEERDGKPTKVPYCLRGSRASTTDPATWATFEDVRLVAANTSKYDGVGFVFTADDPYVGVDLDVFDSTAGAIVARLDSYTEASVSGRGVHVIVRASLNGHPRHRKGPLEVYEHGRYFAFTGRHVRGTPPTIEDRQAELEEVLDFFLAATEPQPSITVQVDGTDDELLARAFHARNGDAVRRLYSGDMAGYGSHSEADLALCGVLAFWTGPDPARIDTLFRRSGLMRPKWDSRRGETTYGAQTIAAAITGRTTFYTSTNSFPPPIDKEPGGNERETGGELPFAALADTIEHVPAEPPWLVRGYLAPSAVSLVSGSPKVGKSTLVFAMLAAVAVGGEFVGLEANPAGVLVLTEERRDSLAAKARALGLHSATVRLPKGGGKHFPRVHVLMRHDAGATAWPEVVRQAMGYCVQHDLAVLVVDTFGSWANLRGDAENAAGAVTEALEPLQYAAAAGLAVLLVVHRRKGAGEFGEAVRGSSALTGGVDIVAELERPSRALQLGSHARVLRTVSRFDSTPEELYLELADSGFVSIESPEQVAVDAERARVAAALEAADEPATAETLGEELDLPKSTVRRHLRALLDRGVVCRDGQGRKNDPYTWRLAPDEASAA